VPGSNRDVVRSWLGGALILVAACAPSASVTRSSPPAATSEIPTCSRERLTFLVEQFFYRYNARDLDGFLALFNWASPAAGGGFAGYDDNPDQPHQFNDRGLLSEYVRGRWALDDRFPSHTSAYPSEGSAGYPVGNPTVEFTRTFSGASQTGNAKLVCNAGLLVGVVMSSGR
jgi:hypothetical protein